MLGFLATFSGHCSFVWSYLGASYAGGFALHRCHLEPNLKSSGCLFQVELLVTVSLIIIKRGNSLLYQSVNSPYCSVFTMVYMRWRIISSMRPWRPLGTSGNFLTRHTVKNGISNLYILLKSALKMQEMPFQRPKIQTIFGGHAPGPPYNCVITMASPSLNSWLRYCVQWVSG